MHSGPQLRGDQDELNPIFYTVVQKIGYLLHFQINPIYMDRIFVTKNIM